MIIGASQIRGYRRTALHKLGSLDDHAYVLSDAGISSLSIDLNPMFVKRALGLLQRGTRSSRPLLSGQCLRSSKTWLYTSPLRQPSSSCNRW